jgi:tRNA (guanine37-N1)-methyltransferase
MKIDILSIFPNMFEGFLNESIIKRAREKGIVDIKIHDFRLFSKDPHKKVDDYQFGGGKGMILMPEPIYDCVESIKTEDSYVILMTPQGEKYNQKKANELKNHKHLIIICGHYEGFDERIRY